MKEPLLTIGLLTIGLVASSCKQQVIAQAPQPDSQRVPMNSPTPEPAPDPQDANRQLPPTSRGSKGFPPPTNPAADIGERGAAQRALGVVAARYRESNPRVIKSSVMSYKEALQLGSEPLSVAEEDELANTSVRVVEMTGVFKVRNHARREAPASTLSYTKAYVILRAADGLELGSRLFAE